jgi:hypothetical protein
MAKQTFRGSCKCGRITFEADVDLAAGTRKCNCTSCWKRRWWSAAVKPDAFRATGGETELSEYRPGQVTGHRGFCKHCGVIPYGWIDAAAWNDGAYVSINVACLDDLDPAALVAAPVQYMDGRHDNWWVTPAETRHL